MHPLKHVSVFPSLQFLGYGGLSLVLKQNSFAFALELIASLPTDFFILLNEFITFIVVQGSSQPNFIAFPSETPSPSPHPVSGFVFSSYLIPRLWVEQGQDHMHQ